MRTRCAPWADTHPRGAHACARARRACAAACVRYLDASLPGELVGGSRKSKAVTGSPSAGDRWRNVTWMTLFPFSDSPISHDPAPGGKPKLGGKQSFSSAPETKPGMFPNPSEHAQHRHKTYGHPIKSQDNWQRHHPPQFQHHASLPCCQPKGCDRHAEQGAHGCNLGRRSPQLSRGHGLRLPAADHSELWSQRAKRMPATTTVRRACNVLTEPGYPRCSPDAKAIPGQPREQVPDMPRASAQPGSRAATARGSGWR
jgi:hypothetical protein